MQSVRNIILYNSEKYENFAYYDSIIEVIEQNVNSNPDITIESCKALIEGISKTILKALDATYNQAEIDNSDFQQLFKKALFKLSEYNTELEFDFVHRAGSLVHILGEIRNKRGDISHGKLAPKELYSYRQFSNLVMQVTEGIVFYVLELFFAVDLSYKQEINYGDKMAFNQMLDESNPIENISYSKALFDQDNVAYFEQLLDYETEQEELKNSEIEIIE